MDNPLSFVALAMSGPLIKPKEQPAPKWRRKCNACGITQAAKYYRSLEVLTCQACVAKAKLARRAKRRAGVTEV